MLEKVGVYLENFFTSFTSLICEKSSCASTFLVGPDVDGLNNLDPNVSTPSLTVVFTGLGCSDGGENFITVLLTP